jgi:hypothetical protein
MNPMHVRCIQLDTQTECTSNAAHPWQEVLGHKTVCHVVRWAKALAAAMILQELVINYQNLDNNLGIHHFSLVHQQLTCTLIS